MTLSITILGLSITSSWGNGHATTYRALVRELCRAGHAVTFLERDVPWYADNRDLPRPPYGDTYLYSDLMELRRRHLRAIRDADLVVVGSYVPEGRAVGDLVQASARGVRAFYDIDTPVTLASLESGTCEYLAREQVPGYQLYLSFTGGPTLARIERELGSPAARPLYCAADPELHRPERTARRFDLGYLGTYSPDRQPVLERLLIEPARRLRTGRFAVAGPQYPDTIGWPRNVERIDHLAPPEHAAFYGAQRFTLNVTRADMVRAGYSPSVRLFEAALCGTPVITDAWAGLDSFFSVGEEILVANGTEDVTDLLDGLSEDRRLAVGRRARERVLAEHTAAHRARTLTSYVEEVTGSWARRARAGDPRRPA
jgi:spore maturation protein CgeB